MPLMLVQSGRNVVLKEITWGRKLKKKLMDMGLTPGVSFQVVSAGSRGPAVIDVRGTRLVLGKGVLSKIIVEEAA